MAQGLIGDFPKLGRDTEKEEEEIMKYLEGCLGETRRRSTEPRLTLVSFKICSKLSLNTLDNHFIPFLTGQQSSQLRSMPKNCAFYTNDGNLRKSWAFLDIVYYKSNSFYYFSAERLWQGLYRRKNKKKRSRNSSLEEREEKDGEYETL